MRQWVWNFGVLFSQFISVCLGGHPDHSVSQRTARAYLHYKGSGRWQETWFTWQMAAIDWPFAVLGVEENHCLNSLNGESGAKEIWNWED